MLQADDIPQLRARLSAAQQTLAALLAQEAPGDAAQSQRIAEARAQIAALTAALRAQDAMVGGGDLQASAPQQPTITTTGGAYAEGELHQQGVFVQGGTVQGPVIGVQTGGTIVIQSPQPALSAQERRNRSRMLQKVRDFWIGGVLAPSLVGAARFPIALSMQPAAVASPWDQMVVHADPLPLTVSPDAPIGAVFDALGGELLILGAPGSGKTTLLLELARDLLDRATRDDAFPLPVIFTLSTWTARRAPLAEWFVQELIARYDVPRPIAQAWVAREQLLPLLDSLDEVATTHRAACVQAINDYHHAHGLLPLVVCSRSTDYAALPAKLQLRGAVSIQPLTAAQVAHYLASVDAPPAIDVTLAADDALRDLATTPLVLRLLPVAFRDADQSALPAGSSSALWQTTLFDAYVAQMLARPRSGPLYTLAQTRRWLGWLARAMRDQQQTVFALEDLQPPWLGSRAQRASAVVLRGLLSMLGGGLLGALIGLMAEALNPHSGMGTRLGVVVGLAGGLLMGVGGDRLRLFRRHIEPVETIAWSWHDMRANLAATLQFALGTVVVAAVVFSVLFGWESGLTFGLIGGIGTGLAVNVVNGLNGQRVAALRRPNQGIWRSCEYGLLLGAGFGILGVSLGWGISLVVVALGGALEGGAYGGALYALITGAGAGFMLYGGFAWLQHLIVRTLLKLRGAAPLDYVRFLDTCADRLLLRKVGGGYIFIHRMLLDYFAALEPEGTIHDP